MLKKLSNFINFNTREDNKVFNSRSTSAEIESFDFLKLIAAWKEIAGTKLSEHTIPLKNQNGVLTVLSNHSAFANEMKFMEIPLKKNIFKKFPNLERNIKTINFIVDSTHFQKQLEVLATINKENRAPVNLPHPYSPESKLLSKEAQELTKDIADEELKKAMQSLYIQAKFNSK